MSHIGCICPALGIAICFHNCCDTVVYSAQCLPLSDPGSRVTDLFCMLNFGCCMKAYYLMIVQTRERMYTFWMVMFQEMEPGFLLIMTPVMCSK
jgi:hypothetical protein